MARDPRIDALRAKIVCVEDPAYTRDYHDPAKRSIANALTVEFEDGARLDEVVCEYPIGHLRRRSGASRCWKPSSAPTSPACSRTGSSAHPRCLAGSGAAGGDAGERIRRPLCDLGGMGIPEAPVALPSHALDLAQRPRPPDRPGARKPRLTMRLSTQTGPRHGHALGQDLPYRLHRLLVRRAVLPAAHLRQPGPAIRRLGPGHPAGHGAPAVPLHHPAGRGRRGLRHVAVSGLPHRRGSGNGWMHAKLFSCCS